jgi:signal transduction histidine kinase
MTDQDLKRRNVILGRLLEVSLVLNSKLALAPLLDFIMEAVCEITSAEAASILLYDRHNDELRFSATNSPGADLEEMAQIPVPMEGSIAGQIARENRPIVIQDALTDPRIYRPVDQKIGFQTRSLLGVPMQIKGEMVGVLEAVNKKEGSWSDDDRNHLFILASQAAVAIQNARQTEELKRAYEQLDKLDKLKSDFIAIASHELRTPLGVILGYASFLKEEASGRYEDHATAVLNSALHLRNVIEDLTNLRFLQLGRVDITSEVVPLSALIRAAQSDVQDLAVAKGHQLTIDLSGGDPGVEVDRIKIGMAITNMLNNAVKFTPKGGNILIETEYRPDEAWIKITDNGVGIPPESLNKVFDDFYQVEDHMTRRHNGMGIGLSIAKGMVEAHNGRVWAESEGEGKGSTFVIALPLSS